MNRKRWFWAVLAALLAMGATRLVADDGEVIEAFSRLMGGRVTNADTAAAGTVPTKNADGTVTWTTPAGGGVTDVHGTTNQVNVSGTTGSVTFSTPQDIATTSLVRHGSLGIGVTAPASGVQVQSGWAAIGSQTVTANQPAVNLDQTWNALGGQFHFFDNNVTESVAPEGSSTLVRFKVGGTSKFEVRRNGQLSTGLFTFPDAAPVAGYVMTALDSSHAQWAAPAPTGSTAVVSALDRVVTSTTVSGTSVETNAYSYSVPGGTLSTNNRLRVQLLGSLSSAAVSPGTLTVKCYYGATSISVISGVTLNTNDSSAALMVDFFVTAANATGSQVLFGVIDTADTTLDAAPDLARGTASIDSTANQTLKITVTFSSSSGSNSFVAENVFTELLSTTGGGGGGGGSGTATALATTGASVDVASAAPPAANKVLTATDATHSTWQVAQQIYPTRFIQGCLVTYASATTAAVSAGSWRDAADAADVKSFAAVASVDCTAAGAAGIDQLVISQTGSSTSPTITASADITGNFNTATLTGTVSTSTTTLTGSGSKFTTELSVGDLVGTTTKGYSRITVVTSDTAATLVAALPGGDASAGATGKRFDNPTIWIAATTSNKRMVNTISSAGTAIVVDVVPGAISNLGAGQTLTIGVAPNLSGESTTDYWLHMWVRSGGSGQTAAWSTQWRTPYTISGYSTSARRVGAFYMVGGNSTPVLQYCFQREVSSFIRDTFFEDASNAHNTRVLSAGTSTSWAQVFASAVVPPSARQAYFYDDCTSTVITDNFSTREHGLGSSTTTRPQVIFALTTSANGGTNVPLLTSVDATQSFDYAVSGTGTVKAYVDCFGFRESL